MFLENLLKENIEKARFGTRQKERTPSRPETNIAYKTNGFFNILGAPRTRIFEIWRKSSEQVSKKDSKKEPPGCHYSKSENISAIIVPFAYARVPLVGHFWAPFCDKEITGMAKITKKTSVL